MLKQTKKVRLNDCDFVNFLIIKKGQLSYFIL
jgi:hypothetical protein